MFRGGSGQVKFTIGVTELSKSGGGLGVQSQ